MPRYYATTNCDDGRIFENAGIDAFETMDEVRAYLLRGYDAVDWKLDTAEIGPARFGDCWVKVHSAPRAKDGGFVAGLFDGAPFRPDQLRVSGPGEHPGGRAWWIEPTEEVLAVLSIEPREP